MKPKEILVFGATGQIGRHLIRKLTKNNYKVIAVTRNIHQKGYILKTQANPGYLEIVEMKSFDIDKIQSLMTNCSVCINLVGILFEKKKNNFINIHTNFPDQLSKLCNILKLDQFIHISSLGIEDAIDSKYANSKIEGEKVVNKNFHQSVILRPSIVYSVDDNFTTNFMSLLSMFPFLPIYYKGKTKFTPIHVTDLTEIIFEIIKRNITNQTIECIGPEVLSFKDIILKLSISIDKKILLIPLSPLFAKITTKILEKFPKPILTTDQLKLLKYDNIISGKYKTNFDLGINSNKKFENEIAKYSFNWKKGGQFSKKISNNN
tara:strand:- start:936 stop:1895 length:960 start_codon:yes stop_codon:yes gene_type:complete